MNTFRIERNAAVLGGEWLDGFASRFLDCVQSRKTNGHLGDRRLG